MCSEKSVVLSPDSALPLLPVSSSSQFLHPFLFPSFLLFSTLASSPVRLFSFCLASFCWFPKKIKVTVCCQQDLLLWPFCSSEESVHSWSGWSMPAPSASSTTNQLSLSWQPVSQHSCNEQWINILLYPHCSLCDLRHYCCVLFKEWCEYTVINFCKDLSLGFMTTGSKCITKHWVWGPVLGLFFFLLLRKWNTLHVLWLIYETFSLIIWYYR